MKTEELILRGPTFLVAVARKDPPPHREGRGRTRGGSEEGARAPKEAVGPAQESPERDARQLRIMKK